MDAGSPPTQPDPPKPLWIKVKNSSTGRDYYYNTKTAERSWTRPADFVDDAPSTPSPTSSDDKPHVVYRLADTRTGRDYFWDVAANKTSWIAPKGATVRDKTTAAELVGGDRESALRYGILAATGGGGRRSFDSLVRFDWFCGLFLNTDLNVLRQSIVFNFNITPFFVLFAYFIYFILFSFVAFYFTSNIFNAIICGGSNTNRARSFRK
jgi:hypothetical protein